MKELSTQPTTEVVGNSRRNERGHVLLVIRLRVLFQIQKPKEESLWGDLPREALTRDRPLSRRSR
jgi:hypothetical protein